MTTHVRKLINKFETLATEQKGKESFEDFLARKGMSRSLGRLEVFSIPEREQSDTALLLQQGKTSVGILPVPEEAKVFAVETTDDDDVPELELVDNDNYVSSAAPKREEAKIEVLPLPEKTRVEVASKLEEIKTEVLPPLETKIELLPPLEEVKREETKTEVLPPLEEVKREEIKTELLPPLEEVRIEVVSSLEEEVKTVIIEVKDEVVSKAESKLESKLESEPESKDEVVTKTESELESKRETKHERCDTCDSKYCPELGNFASSVPSYECGRKLLGNRDAALLYLHAHEKKWGSGRQWSDVDIKDLQRVQKLCHPSIPGFSK